MHFLRNTWYIAAWDQEVRPGHLLTRTILGEPLVLFRDSAGRSLALQDRCPHRFAPLHRGTLVGDAIQCGYHGLRFDGIGTCVHNPHGAVPRTARVRAYPVIERHSFLWLWMGDAERADSALIPDFGFQNPSEWCVGKGYLHVKSNYLLEIDNIMDLSHTEFLHATTLGSKGISKGDYRAYEEAGSVWSNRVTHGEVMNDNLCDAMGVPRNAPVDRWIYVRWNAPANMALYAGAVLAGEPQTPDRQTPGAHCFTPESDATTHYWFSICFPRTMGPMAEQIAQQNIAYIRAPFEAEDLPMLEAQQVSIGEVDLMELRPVLLAGDAGGVRARRALSKLIAGDQATAS